MNINCFKHFLSLFRLISQQSSFSQREPSQERTHSHAHIFISPTSLYKPCFFVHTHTWSRVYFYHSMKRTRAARVFTLKLPPPFKSCSITLIYAFRTFRLLHGQSCCRCCCCCCCCFIVRIGRAPSVDAKFRLVYVRRYSPTRASTQVKAASI